MENNCINAVWQLPTGKHAAYLKMAKSSSAVPKIGTTLPNYNISNIWIMSLSYLRNFGQFWIWAIFSLILEGKGLK